MSYNKLVRDKIPEIIKKNGQKPITRILNDAEYLQELTVKLREETDEFAAEPSLEELADIQEVVLGLLEVLGASVESLEKIRTDKASKRGVFKKRIFLEAVEDRSTDL